MTSSTVTRYTDEELEEFRLLILDRLQKAKDEMADLRLQIMEITENLSGDFGNDYVDDSSVIGDLELLNNMSIRKRKHIQDLENALIRIKNKAYGICVITGQLIDKARLRAVPTTTKTLQGKDIEKNPPPKVQDDSDEEDQPKKAPSSEKKIITKVIRKPVAPPSPRPPVDEEDDDDFIDDDLLPNYDDDIDDDLDNDDDNNTSSEADPEEFDFDSVADGEAI